MDLPKGKSVSSSGLKITHVVGRHLQVELVHLTRCAILDFAHFAIVLITEIVVAKQRVRDEGLQDDVHEACLAKVKKSPTACGLCERRCSHI